MAKVSNDAERVLRTLYDHLATMREADLFRSVGLPRSPTWPEFRRHYDRDGKPDVDRAFADATAFPPTRERIDKMRTRFRETIAGHRKVIAFRPRK